MSPWTYCKRHQEWYEGAKQDACDACLRESVKIEYCAKCGCSYTNGCELHRKDPEAPAPVRFERRVA